MSAAVQLGVGRAQRAPGGSADQINSTSGGILAKLEAQSTTILTLTVLLSLLLLWEGYPDVIGARPGALMVSLVEGLPSYSFKTFVTIGHVMGLVLSFGAVMFLDLFLLRYLWFRPIPAHAFEVAVFGSWLVIAGLAVMWVTGLAFLLIYRIADPVSLDNPKLLAKVVVVSLLSFNGMLIHHRILPMLKQKSGRKLLDGESRRGTRIILSAGAVSFSSWTFAVILGLSKELNFTVSWGSLLIAYAVLTAAVFIAMNAVIVTLGRQPASKEPKRSVPRPQTMILGSNLRTLL